MNDSFNDNDSRWNELIQAVLGGETEELQFHIAADPKCIELRGSTGRTLLHYACVADWNIGDNQVMELLLAGGVSLESLANDREGEGWSPFLFACFYGSVEKVRILLDHGCNPYLKDSEERTGMGLAIMGGYHTLGKAKLLLSRGIKIDCLMENGECITELVSEEIRAYNEAIAVNSVSLYVDSSIQEATLQQMRETRNDLVELREILGKLCPNSVKEEGEKA